MKFALVEPLRELFKDEVRAARRRTRPAEEIVWRQPFPGPGPRRPRASATSPREQARHPAQAPTPSCVEEMKAAGLYYKIWQAFAVLLPVRSVGVQGDERTYDCDHRHPRRGVARTA
jgi:GMP synthase (glutamine-hydrolysing)